MPGDKMAKRLTKKEKDLAVTYVKILDDLTTRMLHTGIYPKEFLQQYVYGIPDKTEWQQYVKKQKQLQKQK